MIRTMQTIESDSLNQCAPVLALISSRLVRDPEWSIKLLEPVAEQLIVPLLRQERDEAVSLSHAIEAAVKLAQQGGCTVEDRIIAAQLLARAERLGEALDWVDWALSTRMDQSEYHRLRASLLERMGRFDEAIPAAERALALNPANVPLREDLSRIRAAYLDRLRQQLRDVTQSDVAIAAGLTLVRQQSASGQDWQALAELYAMTGQLHEALGALERAVGTSAALISDDRYLCLLASVLERQGRLEEAMAALQKVISMKRSECNAAEQFARIEARYFDLQRRQRDVETDPFAAIEAGLKLAHRQPASNENCLALAQLLAKQERLLEALYWAERALSIGPAGAEGYRLKASLLERLGQYRKGYRAARLACAHDPANPQLALDAKRIRLRWLARTFGISSFIGRSRQRGWAHGSASG